VTCRAFTLVEVVLAIGIIAIGVLVVIGLLPQGLRSNHDSIEETQAINLLQALVADRHSAGYTTNSPLYNLPALTTVTAAQSGTLYVMEDTVTTNSTANSARFRVDYTVYPVTTVFADGTNNATALTRPVAIDFRISWPAPAPVTNSPSHVETIATFMQP
jgi:uncharacterized protein (TIGR02598 family)